MPCPKCITPAGYAYQQKGDLQHALQDFEQVVRLAPQFPGAQETLKTIREKLAGPQK